MKNISIYSFIIGISMVLSSCGENTFSQKRPTIKRQELSAGAEGASLGFRQVLADADRLSGEGAGDKLARIIADTQFTLLKINGTSLSLAQGEEAGHCLAHSAAQPFQKDELGEGLELSFGGRVAYSIAKDMKASECQDFMKEVLGPKLTKDFFDIHVSFYSFAF